MNKVLIFGLMFVLSFQFVFAFCDNGQVDVNSASLMDLDKLSGIGPAKAQEIVNSRPFESVEDLIDVKGIGEVTLSNIKVQGLACVSEEYVESSNEESEANQTKEVVKEEFVSEISDLENNKSLEIKTIELNPKVIKTEENRDLKKDTALSGLVVFCVLLGILFMLRKKRYKNEFE